MANATLKADKHVLDILRRATIGDGFLLLPEKLERADYVKVDKFLRAAGAIWNRKDNRHDLPAIAKLNVQALLGSGVLIDRKILYQAFHTPASLARELVDLAEVAPGMRCLEPSAGHGAIAEALRAIGAHVHCVEIDTSAVEVLRGKGFDTDAADFLQSVPGAGNTYDRIVMNPPFTNDQDVQHVRHAFSHLKPGGRLIAIVSTGYIWSGNNKNKIWLRDFITSSGKSIRELPAGAFAESGTDVRTAIISLNRPHASPRKVTKK